MARADALRRSDGALISQRIRIFTLPVRLLWVAIVVATVLSEVLPAPRTTPLLFHTYQGLKAVGFLLVGYLAPLSFWQFNALNRGILYGALSATLVETLQSVIGNGHRFHWYELLLKLGLLLVGFILALDARYEHSIRLGPIMIPLEWPAHIPATGRSKRK